MKFTEQNIKKLLKAGFKDKWIVDDQTPGLYLRIRDTSATWYRIETINGRKRRTSLGRLQQVSLEYARALMTKRVTEGSRLTFKSMSKLYLDYRPGKPGTMANKEGLSRRACEFIGGRRIGEISSRDIDMLHAEIASSAPVMANRTCEHIRAVFNLAKRWGYVDHNPASGFKKSKEYRRKRKLNAEEIPRFLKALEQEENKSAADAIFMLLLTGKRLNEILKLRWAQVDLQSAQVYIIDSKSDKATTLFLSEPVVRMLVKRKMVACSQWVFPSPVDNSRPIYGVSKAKKRICKAAGVENFNIHDLRRTLGSAINEQGFSAFAVRDALGQKDLRSTQIYVELDTHNVQQALDAAGRAIVGMSGGIDVAY